MDTEPKSRNSGIPVSVCDTKTRKKTGSVLVLYLYTGIRYRNPTFRYLPFPLQNARVRYTGTPTPTAKLLFLPSQPNNIISEMAESESFADAILDAVAKYVPPPPRHSHKPGWCKTAETSASIKNSTGCEGGCPTSQAQEGPKCVEDAEDGVRESAKSD